MKTGGLRKGAGEPVVLLHCSSSAGLQWRHLVDRLADRFEVFAPDLIGYGETDAWPAEEPLTPEDEIALVRRALPDPENAVHLVGHSYGGLLALHAALGGSLLLKSLTLIEPTAFWLLRENGESDAFAEILAVGQGFNAGVDSGDPEPGVSAYFDYWNGESAWESASEDLRAYVLATASKTYREWASIYEPTTPLSAFAELDAPTMLVMGSNTPSPAARVVAMLHDVLPSLRVEVIRDAGHMAPITHPEDVNAVIDAFITGSTGRSAE